MIRFCFQIYKKKLVQKLNLIAYGKFLPYFLLIKLTANLRKTAAYSIDKLVIQPPIQGSNIMALCCLSQLQEF